MSLDKLRKEKAKIEKAISLQEAKDRKVAMAKVVAIARDSGIDLAELVSGTARKARASVSTTKTTAVRKKKKVAAKRGKVPPKYRNPADADQTWTGRGKQPVWVREHLESGGTLESITI
ncbi:H-NS histone family protein [Granulosicoccus sp. 3-233]|uniref:H-NS histone family protein n=1 Tax=Granulosicoccus sp. 3-233 TaxID=3417969 RepID=UPI003D32AC99